MELKKLEEVSENATFIDSPATICAANYVKDVLPVIAGGIKKRTKKTNDPTTTRLVRDTRKFWFQQDLARPHTAKVSQKWCKNNLPNFIDSKRAPPAFVEWPVEAFFGELKRRVYKAGRYENLRTLKMAIRRECRSRWVFDWLKATFATMDDRIQAVIDAKGQYTGY